MPTVAQLKQQVDRIWVASFQTDLADTLAAHLRRHALAGVQAALEAALVEELEAHRQRERQSHPGVLFQRSGTYTRRVLTSHGFIPDLHVPKLRGGNADRPWHVLRRYQLAMPLVLDQALYLYTLGLSLRDLQEALYVLFGHVLSREAVNRVTIAAQSPMETWRNRPITDTPPILIVDGVWGQVLFPTGATWTDQSGHERREMRGQDQVILTVMGVWPDGRHQIIHYQLATAEDTAAWSELLTALIARGLDANAVQLVVSDGSTGLPSALATHLPHAKQQRCVVHKIRGLERVFCYRDLTLTDPVTQEPLTHEAARRLRRQQLSTDAHAIFDAPTRAEAEARLAQFRTTWGTLEPEVVRLLTKDVDTCLTFYQCDHRLHPLIRSTNLLEIVFPQMTKSGPRAGGRGGDHIMDRHLVIRHDHPIDQQLDQGPPLRKRRGGQPCPHLRTEGVDRVRDRTQFDPLLREGLQLLQLASHAAGPLRQIVVLAFKDRQIDGGSQVGIQQPFLLAGQLADRLLQPRASRLQFLGQPGPALRTLERRPDLRRVGEHGTKVGPHYRIQLLGRRVAGGAALGGWSAQHIGPPTTQVPKFRPKSRPGAAARAEHVTMMVLVRTCS